jgi:sec-independent protein translocase protein TatA
MGPLELILILAVVLVVFGATRVPRLARSMGRTRDEFKAGLHEPAQDRPDGS